MSNLNKVQIIGRLGKAPEMRYMPDGKAIASFSVAVSEKWKDKQGQQQEATEWFNVSMFGRVAEIAGEYLDKGSLVYLEGKQKTEKWAKDGVDQYSTKLIAHELKMLSSKSESQGQQSRPQQNRPAQQPQQAPKMQEPDIDFDNEIPF
jgi:single-strand DNA-binding protein